VGKQEFMTGDVTTEPSIKSYQDLDVWKLSVDLVEDCYRATAAFPKEEIYGMTSQIRRAAVSIPANIAEGYGRDQTGYFIQFLKISQGSARELETHLLIAARLGLLTSEAAKPLQSQCERICKMLRSLIRSIESRSSRNA
jgi:four helix bundle protein